MGEIADSLAERMASMLEEWLADQGGGMVGQYALVLNYYDSEGETSWATAYADRQTPAATLGLLRWQTISVEQQARRFFDAAHEDDD